MAVGFAINTEDCFGCKACQMACENEHVDKNVVFRRRVRKVASSDGGGFTFVSMACNHCDDPQCLKVCPVGAYHKLEDGTVVQDHERCIGCQSCIKSCPFHAPSYDPEERRVYKCDGCIQRRRAGLDPRCVAECPGKNIKFGEVNDMASAYEDARSVKDQAPTNPNLYVRFSEKLPSDAFQHIDGGTTTELGGPVVTV